jgi:hypothetical protein
MATASIPLAEIRKTRFAHRIIRRGTALTERAECWEAVTTDGLWIFEREESPGTPWIVRHKPTGEFVDLRSTLRDCRWYVAAGHAQAMLERLQAHDRGEHDGQHDSWCARC